MRLDGSPGGVSYRTPYVIIKLYNHSARAPYGAKTETLCMEYRPRVCPDASLQADPTIG